jgi:hypothetical protein
MMEQFRSDAAWKQDGERDPDPGCGLGTVGAEPARKYHWISTRQAPLQRRRVGRCAVRLRLQVETARAGASGAVRVRYSDFDSAAIQIATPN